MKKYINIITLSIALVFTFSISTFAKSDVNHASKAITTTEKLAKQLNSVNPKMSQQVSGKLNLLKTKCGKSQEDWSPACLAAVYGLILDLTNDATCQTIIKDCWAVIKNCWSDLFGDAPNRDRQTLKNTQANFTDFNKNLKKSNVKTKVVRTQFLTTSAATS